MSDEKYPKRKNHRLKNFDYSAGYSYHAVFNVKDENVYLSRIVETTDESPAVILTACGKIVDGIIRNIESLYKGVIVETYTIMPKHVHLLVTITNDEQSKAKTSLSKIIRGIKSFTTKKIGNNIWQRLYYDTVIDNDKAFFEVYDYIKANPVEHLLFEKERLFRKNHCDENILPQ